MTEAMPFLQKYDITFLRPPTIDAGLVFSVEVPSNSCLIPINPIYTSHPIY